jgi:hypothetical protein
MRVGFGATQTFGEVCLSSEAASDYLLSLCSHGGYSESPPVRVARDSKGKQKRYHSDATRDRDCCDSAGMNAITNPTANDFGKSENRSPAFFALLNQLAQHADHARHGG